MANYKFGQFRRSQVTDFVKPLQINGFENIDTEIPYANFTFKDKAIVLEGKNILSAVDDTRTKSRSYFLKYKIRKQEEEQVITIKLLKSKEELDNEQFLTTITVPKGNPSEYFSFDLVISPNSTYDRIAFILHRNASDYNFEEGAETGAYGRIVEIEVEYYEEIINIIDTYLNASIDNVGLLKQIGVQGPPGMLMCIEGEGIRIGRSGIYEINNGVVISFFGVVIHSDEENHFFLDYQY